MTEKTNNINYLVVLTPTINNLFININSKTGHLFKTFSFSSIRVNAADHRKRKIFSSEFGYYFGKYLTNLKDLSKQIEVKINGTDSRTFSFLQSYITAGGIFINIKFKTLNSFNGCKPPKKKRL